jgi:antitoxin (DNA-binding transcriptional repressor) of toxin-antitoxin stability system
MRSVPVREAQHNLARVLRAVQGGETVEAMRRKVPVARIVPVPPAPEPPGGIAWSGHADRMVAIWGRGQVSSLREVLDDLLDD